MVMWFHRKYDFAKDEHARLVGMLLGYEPYEFKLDRFKLVFERHELTAATKYPCRIGGSIFTLRRDWSGVQQCARYA